MLMSLGRTTTDAFSPPLIVVPTTRSSISCIRSNNNIHHRLFAPKTVGYNPLLVVLNEKKEKQVQDDADQDDDGWGFDLDDKVVADFDPSSLSSASGSSADKEERDLFIPIVAIVSILGFTGLYAFEMMRLFFQGELYLPFMH